MKNCLNSLQEQTEKGFEVILVDYGSEAFYANGLNELVANYSFIKLVTCPVQSQLWNKSRAINIALKQTTSPYFLVGDIDMMYSNNFVEILHKHKKKDAIIYFQVGFLSETESMQSKPFKLYKIKHISGEEATGITLYPTTILKEINGYDEFYHGWGAEDADVHVRLKNAGINSHFYQDEVLIKHLYHPKTYRSKESKEPFHSSLEKINHQYMLQQAALKATKANLQFDWGILPSQRQLTLLHSNLNKISITNKTNELDAFLIGIFPQLKEPLEICIKKDKQTSILKNILKKLVGKKYVKFHNFYEINDKVLNALITHHRLALYNYTIDWDLKKIILKIVPFEST